MGEIYRREPADLEPRQAFTTTFERDVLRRYVVCAGCNERLHKRSDFELDHEICREIGGKHVPENVRPLCIACHKRKTALDAKIIARAKRLAGETCASPTKRPVAKRADGGWPPKGSRPLGARPMRQERSR